MVLVLSKCDIIYLLTIYMPYIKLYYGQVLTFLAMFSFMEKNKKTTLEVKGWMRKRL